MRLSAPRSFNRTDLVLDKSVYPRFQVDWMHTAAMADALLFGAKFPPIIVAMRNGAPVVLDGFHRVNAYARRKIKRVRARIIDVTEEKYLETATRLNNDSKRGLSAAERASLFVQFRRMHYAKKVIAEILMVPVHTLERWSAKKIEVSKTGNLSVFRKPIEDGNHTLSTDVAEDIPYSSSSAVAVLRQAWGVLRARSFPVNDETCELLGKIVHEANEILAHP